MRVGDLVRADNKTDTGIIVLQSASGSKFLVQWNNGTRMWSHTSILEVVSESR